MADIISADLEHGRVVVRIADGELVIQYVEGDDEYLVQNPGDATIATCIIACHAAARALSKLKQEKQKKQFELFA